MAYLGTKGGKYSPVSTCKAFEMFGTISKLSARHTITVDIVNYATYRDLIHSVRYTVFVCEQSIPADFEVDHYDSVSQHVLAWWQDNAVGTGRLTPDGRIGRLAVTQPLRNRGIGRCIMEKLLEIAKQQHHYEVSLAAQYHAVEFYKKLGFSQDGDTFNELGIKHVMMRKSLR